MSNCVDEHKLVVRMGVMSNDVDEHMLNHRLDETAGEGRKRRLAPFKAWPSCLPLLHPEPSKNGRRFARHMIVCQPLENFATEPMCNQKSCKETGVRSLNATHVVDT